MALCPECKFRFQTLDDEEGMHECPRCGYHPSKRREEAMKNEPKTVRVESCRFMRQKGGRWESGLVVNEGDGPILDMDGKVVPPPIEDWDATRTQVMTYHDEEAKYR